jgi:(R,R)-butanediol dehydrogenase / meso-butanediol dehydrogenase / diacetyl reductase
MKGLAMYGNFRAEVASFPRPKPRKGEVLVKVKSAGICGSDLHFYRDTPEGLGQRSGVVIGHEPSGVVEEVAPDVTAFSPGDRVTVNHTLGCGECDYCKEGSTCMCVDNLGIAASGCGGDAEYLVLSAQSVHRLPDLLTFTDGSFIACTGATAYGALRKVGIVGPEAEAAVRLVVFGLGPVGLSVCLVAAAAGAKVYGVDVSDKRLSFAKVKIPGLKAIKAGGADTAGKIVDIVGGRGADCAVETSGAAAAQRNAVLCLKPRGKASFVGLKDPGDDTPTICVEDIIHFEKKLYGSKVLSKAHYEELMDFMIGHGLHFDTIVTNRVSLDEAPEALATFNAGAEGKFVIEF